MDEKNGDNGPGRRSPCGLRLPQIRTCAINASGSSRYGLAALGDTGRGRTKTRNRRRYFAHDRYPRRRRRDNHFRHRHTTV